MNWQPIETAPKDRSILLFYPYIEEDNNIIQFDYVSVGVWCEEIRHNKTKCYWSNQNFYIMGIRHIKQYQPTHWCEITFPEGEK